MWAAVWFVARRHVLGDWHYFHDAARLLGGPRPLSTYADSPDLQIGPLALIVGLPIARAGPLVVQPVLYGLGLIAMAVSERCWPRAEPVRLLLAGTLAIPVWSFVATSGHLDDALVVLTTTIAALAVKRNQNLVAGLCVGAAIASKPWAVVVIPLLLGLQSRRVRALGAAVTLSVLAWLPFVLGDPGTTSALAGFRLHVVSTSGLQLLGVHGLAPGWVRPAQALLGLALGLLAVRRGRWWAVPAVGLAARVALDPQAMGYYAAGLVVVVLLADGWSRVRLPVGSLVAFAGLFYPAFLTYRAALAGDVLFREGPAAGVVAAVRLLACAGIVTLALLGRTVSAATAATPPAAASASRRTPSATTPAPTPHPDRGAARR